MNKDFFAELKARGLVEQSTDEAALENHLNTGVRTVYCGFDPTADSLHVGSMIPLIMLKRFQNAGHRPIVLVGGATGCIGDPSGKDKERELNDYAIIQEWTAKLHAQARMFLDFDCGETSALAVNNYDWTVKLNAIEFLRDVGKFFSVNTMINLESVKKRLARDNEEGMSYTEFSYSVLQGMDFGHLYKEHNCTIQFGGTDQWGNIVSGLNFIKRTEGSKADAHCLTLPLLTKADGKKFGKSEGGAIWLDAKRTSPYAFYQFWLNSADADVEKLLNFYSFKSVDEIKAIVAQHMEAPHLREGQRALAREITAMIHGDEGVESAERISSSLFSKEGNLGDLSASDLEALKLDGLKATVLTEEDMPLVDVLIQAELAQSKREAREFIGNGAVKVNGEKHDDAEGSVGKAHALHGNFLILQRGKKEFRLASWG